MPRTRTLVTTAASMLALGALVAPAAQAQQLPGGSVSLTPDYVVPVPVPAGSTAAQLPALPLPLAWTPPSPAASPAYVASNWVVPFSYCPARNQRAFAEDGTQLWCTRLELTDAKLWAPYTTLVPYPAPALAPGVPTRTEVANSLGAKPCAEVRATAIDPSNGQEAYCEIDWLNFGYAVWQYNPGS